MRTAFFALFSLFLSLFSAYGQEIVSENGRAYKLHTVKKGEGFYRLSVDNGVTQEDILSANPQLRTTGLVAGVKIKIPLVKGKGGKEEGPAKKAPDTVEQKQVTANKTHTVAAGETAYSVARQYGVDIAALLSANPAAKAGVKVGDILIIPGQQSGYVLHIIAAGETLYSIGTRYGVKAQQILDANFALDAAALPVGSTIRIPASNIPAEDEGYVYHRVAAGETLFALSVKFNLAQDVIKSLNPGLDWNALQLGQIVALPKAATVVETVTYTNHNVGKKETLYSISKSEGISVEELIAANPGLTAESLKKGMTLRIPHRTQSEEHRTPATTDPTYIGNEGEEPAPAAAWDYVAQGRPTIHVMLLLPFNAHHELNEMRKAGVSMSTGTWPFGSRRYVEFYEGVRLALDSLAQGGANIDLQVCDCSSRLAVLNAVQGAKHKPDLIIGPAKREGIGDVLHFALQNHVPVVLPFAQADSAILDNPYAFQASLIDSISSREQYMRQFDDLAGAHVVMVSSSWLSPKDKQRAELFAQACHKRGLDFQNFTYNVKDPRSFLPCLQIGKRNVVLMESTNEAQVNSILTSLSGVIDQKDTASVELWATSAILSYQTIEAEVYHRLNTHVFSSFGIDQNNPATQRVLNLYRQRYSTEPIAFTPYFSRLKKNSGFSEYGLWGYDIALKFVGARTYLGPGFIRRINDYKPPLAQSNFLFRNITNWGGQINLGLKLIVFHRDGRVTVTDLK